MKRVVMALLIFSLVVGISSSFAQAPTALIKTMGVSPRDVEADTSDMFDRIYSGLPNVGVGSPVYLAGNPDDETITSWAWELEVPDESEAALNASDEAIVTFVTDMVGTFTVSLTVESDSGSSEPVSMAINSAEYVGVGGIVGDPEMPQCGVCHGEMAEAWGATGHATFFIEAINGEKSPSYAAYCISCHTVGYNTDEGAVNDGFDDVAAEEEWTFPDTLIESNWEEMVENFPNSAALTNIQCENCHGPGSTHRGNAANIAKTMDVKVCAVCHDAGTHHTRPLEWSYAGHSNPTSYPTGEGRESCVRCHGGLGFIDYVNGVEQDDRRTDWMPFSCQVCHDPHDNSNDDHQLRISEPYTFENDVEVDFGLGNLCLNCHHSRRNAVEYVTEYHSHYGPHHSNQGDMLAGTNAIEYGLDIDSSPHGRILENGCVDCHMADNPVIGEGEDEEVVYSVGGHSWNMENEDDVTNIAVCQECHGEVEEYDEIGNNDYDGDGTVEGVEEEIEAMLEELALLLPPLNSSAVEVDTNYTLKELSAAYNYLFVEEDKSHGLHNGPYAAGILQASMDDLLGVEDEIVTTPRTWALGQAYPNPFNPSASLSYTVGVAGEISLTLYDIMGREIKNLVQGDKRAGVHRTSINLADQPSGIYMVTMKAEGFSATRKIVLMK